MKCLVTGLWNGKTTHGYTGLFNTKAPQNDSLGGLLLVGYK